MEEQASFVRAVVDDNTRLRGELKALQNGKAAELECAQKDMGRLRHLCAALMQKLGMTRIELGGPDYPHWSLGTVNLHYSFSQDSQIAVWDCDTQPGSYRLEFVSAERTSAAA